MATDDDVHPAASREDKKVSSVEQSDPANQQETDSSRDRALGTDMQTTRRLFLSLAGVGVSAGAGCTTLGPDDDGNTETPTSTPTGTETDTPTTTDTNTPTETDTPTETESDTPTETEAEETTEEGRETEEETNEEADDETVYDVTVDSVDARSMDMLDWNSQYAGWPYIWGRWAAYERFVQYDLENNVWIPRLIDNWSIDGTTITLDIRDPHKYEDGDEVTAEDVKANIVMNLATGAPFSEIFESFDEPDDKTLVIETKKSVNKTILEFSIFSQLQQAKMAPPYDEFYQRFWVDGEEGVGRDIQAMEPNEPHYVSGIFGQMRKDSEQYLMERNPEHPDADNVNFERYRFRTYPGNQATWDAMLADEVDTVMSAFTPANVKAELPDHWQEYNFPGNWGVGLLPQHDPDTAPHISKRPVRQAITHAISREAARSAGGPRVKTAFPTPAAISANVQDEWIDVGGTFGPMQGGKAKAAERMQDAGYEKNANGIWAMDGDTVSFDISVPGSWSDWVTVIQATVSQLTQAGFDARLNRVNNIYRIVASGEFKMAARPWSSGYARSSFPYFPLDWVFGRAYDNAHSYPGGEEGTEITVPAMDGDGTISVDVQQRLADLSMARGDDVKPIVEELAWVSHQDLPMIPIVEKLEQSFISTNNLSAPDPDSLAGNVKWPCFYAPREGEMQWQGGQE